MIEKVNQQQSLINNNTYKAALTGCLLGDSSFEKTFINVMHSIKNRDYVEFKYTEFSKFFNVGKIGISNNWGSNQDEALRKAVRFRILRDLSKQRYDLDYFYNILLSKSNPKKRCIPVDYLDELLTPLALLFWFMDDGQFIVRHPTKTYSLFRRRLAITLNSFDDADVLKTVEFINNKYGINFKIERNKDKTNIVRIYVSSATEIFKFLELLYEFNEIIPKSMLYKFQPHFTEREFERIIKGCSTTIERVKEINDISFRTE